jgi:hypothetical protein
MRQGGKHAYGLYVRYLYGIVAAYNNVMAATSATKIKCGS